MIPSPARVLVGLVLLLATASAAGAAPLYRRASLGAGGEEALEVLGHPFVYESAISDDGRFVAFVSRAPNLVPGDTNGDLDVFVRDRLLGTTERVIPNSSEVRISADGRYVAAGAANFILVYDRSAATTVTVPTGFNATPEFDFSADGRHVVYASGGIFVHDLDSGTTTRADVASDGTPANGGSRVPSVSADGRFVAFGSYATNLVPDDTNGRPDAFVHDTVTGSTVRVSVSSGGGETDGIYIDGDNGVRISDDGRFVAFVSGAPNLVPGDTNGVRDVFVHDTMTGTTTRVSTPPGGGEFPFDVLYPMISGDGRYVAFGDLVSLFVHDMVSGETTQVAPSVVQFSFLLGQGRPNDLSADGRFFAFSSETANLVPADTNGQVDVFVYDRSSTCGDGTVDMDEECDDGNTAGGDGCEPDCRRTPCVGGAVIDAASVRLRAGSSVKLKGHLLFPPGAPSGFDPSTTGIQVMVEDVGAAASAFELSARNGVPIPGGPGCGPGDGWTVRRDGAVQSYSNESGALDALCAAGSAHELRRVRLEDRRATRGEIVFSLRAGGGTASVPPVVPSGGMRVTIVLGSMPSDGLAGACATRVFTPSECEVQVRRNGRSLRCR